MSFCSWFGAEKYRDHFDKGVYACANCGTELFHSSKKYEHHTPWPAFYDTVTPDCLSKHKESPSALKVSCAKCGNGLGHEFLGAGPKAGQSRFWIFSASLKFIPK